MSPSRTEAFSELATGLLITRPIFTAAGTFSWELYGEGKTRDYRADVGFNSRTNTNSIASLLGYNSTPKPKASLISYHMHNFTHIDYDFQGRMHIWESEFAAEMILSRADIHRALGMSGLTSESSKKSSGRYARRPRAGAFFGDDSPSVRPTSTTISCRAGQSLARNSASISEPSTGRAISITTSARVAGSRA